MKSKQSKKTNIHISGKHGGAILLILALLILGVNGLLSLRGEALPEEITTVAATVVADSLSSNDVPEAREAVVVEVAPTNLPIPTHSDMPWANADGDFDYYVLALSWQPAFCESQSRKPECASQTRDRYDATNFVLHGLWPNQADDPSHSFAYCAQPSALVSADKAGEWCELPDLALSTAVAHDLSLYMPGVASCLDHHEWYKHGVCAGMDADAYFALSNALAAQFAQTEFNQVVAAHIGREVSRSDLLREFEAEFGPGSADYLSLRCNEVGGVSLLTEIRLVLKKELAMVADFSALFPAEEMRPQGNCPTEFWVDAVN